MGASETANLGLRSCGGDGLPFDVLAGWMAHGEFSGKIDLTEDRQSNCIFENKDPTEARQQLEQVKEKAGPKTNRTFEIPLSYLSRRGSVRYNSLITRQHTASEGLSIGVS
jgi:hypothetical protein